MKILITTIAIFSNLAVADFYKLVNLRRVESNLYSFDSGYVKTKYCYEYIYGENAIYNDDRNEIIFKNGRKCDVDHFLK